MTDIDYAIETLKNLKEEPTLNAKTYIHKHLDIAINSLKAWEKVKHDVEMQYLDTHSDKGREWANHTVDKVLRIIDENLNELDQS